MPAGRSFPLVLLGVVCALSVGARLFHLDIPSESTPGSGFVFDEKYYVNAARVVAGVPMNAVDTYANASPAGTDPNGEHPQLGKVVIAAGIRVLGDNPWGWRITAVLFGTASLLLLYWLVRCLGGSSWLALGTTSIAAIENLWLVSGRIAVLDMYVVPFMLAGAAFYLRRQPVVAGILLGVGACIKEFGVYALLALLLLEALRLVRWVFWDRFAAARAAEPAPVVLPAPAVLEAPAGVAGEVDTGATADAVTGGAGGGGLWSLLRRLARRPATRRAATPIVLCAVTVATFFSLLAVLDRTVTPYHDDHPVDSGQKAICDHMLLWSGACNHFAFMNKYAADLRSVDGPTGIASYPWQFWGDVEPINYYTVTSTVRTGNEVTAVNTVVAYQGLIHPVILVTAWLAILLNLWWAVWRRDDISLFVVVWIVATWLPAEAFSLLDQRTTYLYYMVVTLPAVFLGVARLVGHRFVPRWLLGVWVGLVIAGFTILYPFRTLSGG
ncbi:MAG TPA: phospholipid carrier-dependent glycosyltransferase [Candidatus Dormibacteraeota bacterium]|nr:phospholipid carrier-dependent glycosyltransferase [Candidatus Dormibacteraeota bacterium]